MGVACVIVKSGDIVDEFPKLLNSPNPLACRACKLKVPAFSSLTSYVFGEPSTGVIEATFGFDALVMLRIIGVVECRLLTLTVKTIGSSAL